MDAFAHSNLTGIAIVALAALVCGMTMERVKQPAFVGYILAGLLLGPTAFGIVEDREQINTIAELGVLMLLFVIVEASALGPPREPAAVSAIEGVCGGFGGKAGINHFITD